MPDGEYSARRARREIEILQPFVTEERWNRMRDVLSHRTRYLTVVLEDIYQPHNASAVLRSCDAFGVQDVHIVQNRNRYQTNPGVELGTAQWLSLSRYGSAGDPASYDHTTRCIASLRAAGYRIVATTPHRRGAAPDTIPLEPGPIALLFGTEKEGLSAAALDGADEYLAIPMVGFVESLNISVSVAVTLYALTTRLHSGPIAWRLGDAERDRLLADWLRASVRHAAGILSRAEASGADR